ncbi:UNVERIFIED_CONTAM: hypothetical protein NCL1_42424 [Trichonephila clavipes]
MVEEVIQASSFPACGPNLYVDSEAIGSFANRTCRYLVQDLRMSNLNTESADCQGYPITANSIEKKGFQFPDM